MELKEFDQALSRHDWYYQYSDDIKVWRRGHENQSLLESVAQKSPQHRELFQAYRVWDAKEVAGSPTSRVRLDSVRVRLGVTTQAEVDAVQRVQYDAEAEKLARLQAFAERCQDHDWFYWNHPCDSRSWIEGSHERAELLLYAGRYPQAASPFARLFYTWAKYFSCPQPQRKEVGDQLDALHTELGLKPRWR